MGLFDFPWRKKKAAKAEKAEATNATVEEAVSENIADEEKIEAIPEKEPEVAPKEETPIEAPKAEEVQEPLCFGIETVFDMRNGGNVVVTGKVNGLAKPGMEVFITSFGDDESVTFLSKILDIEIGGKRASEARDCVAGLMLENVADKDIKTGCVLCAGKVPADKLHEAYVGAIGNGYVLRKKFILSDEDFNKMSITDCAESWRMFSWFQSKNADKLTPEQKKTEMDKVQRMGMKLCEKILAADELYVPYNKRTDEPHMFSKTMQRPDGAYVSTPPEVMLITKAYVDSYKTRYPEDIFEIRKIEKGEDGEGIKRFLQEIFYLNGARAVAILSQDVAIASNMLVEKPNWQEVPGVNSSVTNPDLLRWILLLGQMGNLKKSEEEIIYKMYYRFLAAEIQKATLVAPVKFKGKKLKPNGLGVAVQAKNTGIDFPMLDGKDERGAIMMFTDGKRLRKQFGKEWECYSQTADGMIKALDLAINVDEHTSAGAYISKDAYEEMKKMI